MTDSSSQPLTHEASHTVAVQALQQQTSLQLQNYKQNALGLSWITHRFSTTNIN